MVIPLKCPEDSPVSSLTVRRSQNYEEDREAAGASGRGFKTRDSETETGELLRSCLMNSGGFELEIGLHRTYGERE